MLWGWLSAVIFSTLKENIPHNRLLSSHLKLPPGAHPTPYPPSYVQPAEVPGHLCRWRNGPGQLSALEPISCQFPWTSLPGQSTSRETEGQRNEWIPIRMTFSWYPFFCSGKINLSRVRIVLETTMLVAWACQTPQDVSATLYFLSIIPHIVVYPGP